MSDAHGIDPALRPPLSDSESDLIWYAPATGLSGALLFVLFMDLGIVLLLIRSGLLLLGVALLVALGVLVVFSLVRAAHLLGPGGITVQRPFATEGHTWSEFSAFERKGDLLILHYADGSARRPLQLHTGGAAERVAEALTKYLPQLPAEEE